MRFFHFAALSVLWVFAGMAATTASKTTAPKKYTPKTSTSSVKKVASSANAKTRLAKGKTTKAPAATWRTRQQNPTPDRYKEIQQALVDKGYLKGEPSGVWDADSVNALQRFQTDQKLTASGKITAPALIGLGLGAKSAGAPEAAPVSPPTALEPARVPAAAAPQ